MTLQATLIATTVLYRERLAEDTPYKTHAFPAENVSDADELAEFSGRSVYGTWDRPNPNFATNADYIMRLRELGETGNFAHASATFWVTGGSHALVSELLPVAPYLRITQSSLRHGSLSRQALALPGVLEFEDDSAYALDQSFEDAKDDALDTDALLRRFGFADNAARDGAIAFLPLGTEVSLLITGDLETWPSVLDAAFAYDTSAEYFTLGCQVLDSLRQIAPETVRGIMPVRKKRPADNLAGEAVSLEDDYDGCG